MKTSFLNTKSVRNVSRCLAVVALATAGASANAGTLENIWNRVTSINNKASTILSRTNGIQTKVGVLENRPDVRELATQIEPAVVTNVIGAVQAGQDALDILNTQRLGFTQFRDGGGADTMRDDLRYLFDDISTLHVAAQQLRCFQDPEVSIVALNMGYMSDAVDHIPAIALYAMQKALDQTIPEWRSTVSEINDALPIEEVGAVCGAAGAAVAEFERLRCEVLRNINPTPLARTERKARTLSRLFAIIKEYSPDEVTIQFSLTVVGGGGGGTSIKLPLKGIFQTVISVLKRVEDATSRVATQRQACLDADEKIERDVLSCTALASYDSDLEVVRDLVLRRLMSLGATNQTWNQVETANSFGQICTSYREFRVQ